MTEQEANVGKPRRAPNNFAVLRLAGALWVIFDHSFSLLAHPMNTPVLFGTSALGIVIFFSIGGYLIARSWQSKPYFWRYVLNRAIRIFPGLIAVILVSVFVIGPVVTRLTVGDYFGESGTWEYLLNILLNARYPLPGVFETVPYPNAVNGSIWSLMPTFVAYLFVPLFFLGGRRSAIVGYALFGLASGWLYFALPASGISIIVWGSSIADNAGMWAFFAAGGLACLLIKREHFRLDIALVLVILQLLMAQIVPQYSMITLWVFLTYALVAFGLASTPVIRRADRFGDFSYGMFLWGFPVQQLVVYYFGTLPIVLNLAVVILISAGLAFVSLRIVELPAIRLKDRLVAAWDNRSMSRIARPEAMNDSRPIDLKQQSETRK